MDEPELSDLRAVLVVADAVVREVRGVLDSVAEAFVTAA